MVVETKSRKPSSVAARKAAPKPQPTTKPKLASGDDSSSQPTSLSRKSTTHNGNPLHQTKTSSAERAFSAASTLLSGIITISASQFIGAPLKFIDPAFYHAYMSWTKESFAVLVATITQRWSPTPVRVSGDASMKDQLYLMPDGSLRCNFPHRLVLMANHQLYTDWLYLWWTAYTNKMHGHVYIILKESLKQLPILGWGAQFYNFIFLSRKWETDRERFKSALGSLKDARRPMWLLIFPEGTNLSEVTRAKSAAWAKKAGMPDMKHQLLPRTTGLQFCLKELRQTTNWLYDCTIAYEGVPAGQYGQDIFTLKSSFLEGRPPKSVNMFWRRFHISMIPVDSDEAFARWLNNRWREKDYLLEYFEKFHCFPEEDAGKALAAVSGRRKAKPARTIETEVRAGGWEEFLSIFQPITSAAGALSSVDMTEPLNLDALLSKMATNVPLDLLSWNKSAITNASQQAVRQALEAAQRSRALPMPMLKQLMARPPKTQAQMNQALVHSAEKSGNTELAKQARKAPATKRTVPQEVEDGIEQSLKRTKLSTPARVAGTAKTGRSGSASSAVTSMVRTKPPSKTEDASGQSPAIAKVAARATKANTDSFSNKAVQPSRASTGSKKPTTLPSGAVGTAQSKQGAKGRIGSIPTGTKLPLTTTSESGMTPRKIAISGAG